MSRRLSLRWRLILVSWSLALASALALTAILHVRSRRQLLGQLEKTLGTKCDEVITVLESPALHPTLETFLLVETHYRASPFTYFYTIRDGEGHVIARSLNLGGRDLPLPPAWGRGEAGSSIHLETRPHPISPEHERVRIRSELLEVRLAGAGSLTVMIQTAGSLEPLYLAANETLRDAILVGSTALAAILFLLWYVTTRSLRPVTMMTRKASQISATDPQERLPLSGRGDELDELASVLNEMLDRLADSIRQMEQFSVDAAHQLRTPLTRIRGELDLVLAGELSDSERSELEGIQQEVERLGRVCGRLLLLARVDQQAREPGLLHERLDLEAVVAELLEQMAPLASERGVRLVRGTTSRLSVQGNRHLVVEALLNLLDNAIRFTPEGGSVTVSTEEADGTVQLFVADCGPGVPPEERERIFQPFYRLPHGQAAEDDHGTGVGLAIVRAIAQAHGGHVEVHEASEGGSVFRLVLPRHSGS